jgi:signal transduction histidine kinase
MGLGLSVAKSMIEMHGGRIWAESDEGQGSRFIISLPLLDVQGNESGEVSFS